MKRNIIANLLGQGWSAVMMLALVPVYISYMGIDAYGVIGLYVVMETLLLALDAGVTPALSREMARFGAGAHSASALRDMLRTSEVLVISIGVLAGACVALAANWVVSDWLKAAHSIGGDAVIAVRLMGLSLAARLIEGIYRSAVMGLQRQVAVNIVASVAATVRGCGAVGVLAWVSPTLDIFFAWHAAASIAGAIGMALLVYRLLPPALPKAKFSVAALRQMSGFARGMGTIAVLGLLLTQVDRILLSHLLDLRSYGVYMLAATAASGLGMVIAPVGVAMLPRMTHLHATSDEVGFRQSFHQGAQLIAVLAGSAGMMAIVFADRALWAWTGDAELAGRVQPLFQLLVFGNLLAGLLLVPVYAQFACGWTSLAARVNAVAVALLVPTLWLLVPRYGASSAAIVWCCLHGTYLVLVPARMFRRMLKGEQMAWCLQDTLFPVIAAAVVAAAWWALVPFGRLDRAGTALALAVGGLACIIVASMISPPIRSALLAAVYATVKRTFGG